MRYHGEVWLPRRPLFQEALEPDVQSAMWMFYAGNPQRIRSLWRRVAIGGVWRGAHLAGDAPVDLEAECVDGIHPKDLLPVSDLPPGFMAHMLFYRDRAYSVLDWDAAPPGPGPLHGKTLNRLLWELGVTDGFLVTVDCHA